MQHPSFPEQHRAAILDAVIALADLEHRPSALSRARTFVRDVDMSQRSSADMLAEALNEVGQAAASVSYKLGRGDVQNVEILAITHDGIVVRVRNVDGSTVHVDDVVKRRSLTLTINQLQGKAGHIDCVEIFGASRSFLSSDATLPHVRDANRDVHTQYEEPHRLRDLWPIVKRILGSERHDIITVIAYSVFTSLLSLAVPLSSQAIVNAVALGVVNRQLIVLCAVVLVAMMLLGVIAVLERYIVDMIQRRLFVRTSFDIVYRLPLIRSEALKETYAPELVNRFFDVMTVQKSMGKMLLEGISSTLVLITGLLLLVVYHPFFLIYDVAFLFFLPVLTLVLGRGAIPTAIKVSKKKYEAAALMEDIARNHLAFKLTGARDFAFDRIDSVASEYVEARAKHFTIIARQIVGSLIFKAFATVGVLGLGGLLVIEQQISLGQLVAAEIVIIMILGALEKLLAQFDLYYDLMAALDKLSIISDQPLEDIGGRAVPKEKQGGTIAIRQLRLSIDGNDVLAGIDLSVDAQQHLSIVGESGAGKSSLLHVLSGLSSTHEGSVVVNGVDVKDADLRSLRTRIGMVFPENQIIPGTIEQNIMLGRPISREQLEWALRITFLEEDIQQLPNGLRTVLHGTGETLPYGLRRRILFARMIVHRPDILLIDEAFDGIEDSVKLRMLDALFSWPHWTIINVSHDPEVVRRTDNALVLQRGSVIMKGKTKELCQQQGSPFCSLFPDPRPFLNAFSGGHNG